MSVETSNASARLTPAVTYDGTVWSDLDGGLRRRSAYVGNLHFKLTASGDAMALPGTSAYLDVLDIHGGHPSRLVGDAQGTSNIEGSTGTQIEELWIQHNFEGNRLSVLAGLYDVNSEFYRLLSAGLFQNSAFGIGPEFAQSGVEGPSIFPRTAAGLRVAAKPLDNVVVRTAILNGVPFVRPDGSRALFRSGDGALGILEVALLTRPESAPVSQASARDRVGRFSSLSPYDGKVALGIWRYSGKYPDLSDVDSTGHPILRRDSSGAYLMLEHQLLAHPEAGSRRLAAFAQGGVADARPNRFNSHVSVGVVASNWNLLKQTDQFGLSVTSVRNGSHYARSQSVVPGSTTRTSETTVELTYLSQIYKSLAIQPDIQYVVHPNADRSRSNAWVGQLRFEVSY